MSNVHVGGRTVEHDQAVKLGRDYLTGEGWAYPAYDSYCRDTAQGPLTEADLLAPTLLNVMQTRLPTYYALRKILPRLQEGLDALPPDLDLVDADDSHLQALGQLYAVIDERLVGGTRGTRLSKILHRKRPALIPLYDRQVGECYQRGENAPVPLERGRNWASFMPKFAAAVRTDLMAGEATWGAIARLADTPPITHLRALDIVAWRVGGGSLETEPEADEAGEVETENTSG